MVSDCFPSVPVTSICTALHIEFGFEWIWFYWQICGSYRRYTCMGACVNRELDGSTLGANSCHHHSRRFFVSCSARFASASHVLCRSSSRLNRFGVGVWQVWVLCLSRKILCSMANKGGLGIYREAETKRQQDGNQMEKHGQWKAESRAGGKNGARLQKKCLSSHFFFLFYFSSSPLWLFLPLPFTSFLFLFSCPPQHTHTPLSSDGMRSGDAVGEAQSICWDRRTRPT